MNTIPIEVGGIKSKIYLIRGEKVMLDYDLAELYGVPTKRLKEQVRRNIKRFPEDFMFSLLNQEVTALRSQIATSNVGRGGRRIPPLAFTEQGVAMLSTVLNSERAIEVNIEIMRTFVLMKKVQDSDRVFEKRIAALEEKYDGKFKIVFDAIRELMSNQSVPKQRRIIGISQE